MGGRLSCDSAAAVGMTSRRGAGKVLHIETELLWAQRAVKEKLFGVVKEPGSTNMADLGTKFVDKPMLDALLKRMKLGIRTGPTDDDDDDDDDFSVSRRSE